MYIVKADAPDVGFSVDLSDAEFKDSEGNVVSDETLDVKVVSDNEEAVSVSAGPDGRSGTVHFGSLGDAALTATISDTESGRTYGVFGAQFHIVAGDPATMAGGKIAFEGLTEA